LGFHDEVCIVLPDPVLLQDVKGFLGEEEGRRIYTLALEVSGRGPCLEIGSYCGKSTLYLGAACRENASILFTVDHHRGSEEQQPGEEYFDPELWDPRSRSVDTLPTFRRTIARAGLETVVVPLVCSSVVAARAWATPLSLVFIDGGHAEETVRADYLGWSEYLIRGGYLLFHDVFIDPARGGQAPFTVYRQARDDGRFDELSMTETLGVLRRKGRSKIRTFSPL
jgi:predicted O-methyltransferase YrrM